MNKITYTTILCLFLPIFILAQEKTRTLSGIISTKGSPKKDMIVFVPHHPELRDTTDEYGKYELNVLGDIHRLDIMPIGKDVPMYAHLHHRKALRHNFDTEQDLGYFTWRLNSNLHFSNSLFSTYQSGGNNNNQSTLVVNIAYSNSYHKKRFTVDSDVKILFGENRTSVPIKLPNETTLTTRKLIAKSGDLISATSKIGYNMRHHIFLSVLTNFQTQMTKTYADPYAEEKGQPLRVVSHFLSPATFNLGIGFDFKPNRYFSLYISPLNLDAQIVKDKILRPNYNIIEQNGITAHMGAFLNMDWSHIFFKKLFYTAKLQMGTNYRANPKTPNLERPGSIDIQMFKHTLAYKINNHIALSFSAVLRYDEDVKFNLTENDTKTGKTTNIRGPRTQYFQNLGIAIGYNFENHLRIDKKKIEPKPLEKNN